MTGVQEALDLVHDALATQLAGDLTALQAELRDDLGRAVTLALIGLEHVEVLVDGHRVADHQLEPLPFTREVVELQLALGGQVDAVEDLARGALDEEF